MAKKEVLTMEQQDNRLKDSDLPNAKGKYYCQLSLVQVYEEGIVRRMLFNSRKWECQ